MQCMFNSGSFVKTHPNNPIQSPISNSIVSNRLDDRPCYLSFILILLFLLLFLVFSNFSSETWTEPSEFNQTLSFCMNSTINPTRRWEALIFHFIIDISYYNHKSTNIFYNYEFTKLLEIKSIMPYAVIIWRISTPPSEEETSIPYAII